MSPSAKTFEAVTVTLNPAIDRTIGIPNFKAGVVNRVGSDQSVAAGKGVNVAAALADYGRKVAVTGFLGRDNVTLFEALFQKKQIADHFVRIAGETRVGIKIADPVLNQTTDINFPGPAPAPGDLDALFARLNELETEWVVLAGSLPPGVDVSIYRDLISSLKSAGRKVVLDASGEALNRGVESAPQIFKPNIHELEALVGRSLPDLDAIVNAASDLVARGGELVVISMGEAGACFVTADSALVAKPPWVEVKSTVGAGDAMVAGIVAGQLAKMSLEDCARLATAFSLDAITHIGTGLASPGSLEAAMETVSITKHEPVPTST